MEPMALGVVMYCKCLGNNIMGPSKIISDLSSLDGNFGHTDVKLRMQEKLHLGSVIETIPSKGRRQFT